MQKILNAGYMVIALSFALLAPMLVYAQSGTYFDPINVQIQQDPWDAFVQQSQQQSQADSLNQSLRNIQNALSNQSQQQAQFQQQQLIQQKQSQCPPNEKVYVSKVSKKLDCVCTSPYYIENGSCVSAASQPTAPVSNHLRDATCKSLYGPAARASGTGCDGIPASLPTPVAPSKTNGEICRDYYGQYSVWTGQVNDKNGAICDCQSGYAWNSTRTACVAQQFQAPVSSVESRSSGGSSNNANKAIVPAAEPQTDSNHGTASAVISNLVDRVSATTSVPASVTHPVERGVLSLFGFWPWFFRLFGI